MDNNDNALLKMEISGTLNVKNISIFDGILIASTFFRISRRNRHDIARLCLLYSIKTFLKTCKGDVWHFQFFIAWRQF